MKHIKLLEEFKQERALTESLDHREVMNILDAAAGFADDAEVAANQTWRDRKDLIKYLLSDHIAKKDHKKFLAMVGESLEVNEGADWGTYDTPEGKMVSKELEKAWSTFEKTVDGAHKDWLKTVQKYRGEAGKGSGFRDSEGRDAVVSAMEWYLEKVFMADRRFGGIDYKKYRTLLGESVEEAKMPEPRKDEYFFLVRNNDAKDVWKMADDEFGNDIDRGRIEVLFQKNKYVIKDFELAKRFYQYLRDRGVKFFDQNFVSESVEVTESYVPSNIAEFAKRRGVSSLVRKVAGWAEKVGARITGGTAIGKGYNTLILDMGYQTADIRIDVEDETIELYDEPIYSFNDFKRVFMEEESRKQAEHDEETLRREQGLEEVVSKVISKIKEDRPGLWANIHAQRERGEKPARKGSKDYKAAVKAGKEINKKK